MVAVQDLSRQYVFGVTGSSSARGVAGCNDNRDSASPGASPSGLPTPTTDGAPEIIAHEATPRAGGTVLDVFMQGVDAGELAKTAIAYVNATISRIDVASWNDWTEGTRSSQARSAPDYGTDFVEVVEQFQRGAME